MSWRRLPRLLLALAVIAGCSNGDEPESSAPEPDRASEASVSPLRSRPLPPPVQVRQRPEAGLADPAFEPLPGAEAHHGRLGGAVYQIEVPERWNGRLMLFMHGFEEFEPEAEVTPPDFRRYLIGRGYAWGASSFSSTSLIPGRAADETAALWDHFAREHGRPTWTYVSGLSMGGMAAHIAAERYGDRFDGALAFCGAAGMTPALSVGADFFVAAAYAAGVDQAEFDATTDVEGFADRLRVALADPGAHATFERIMVDLTGGPRAFAEEGIHLEEDTNWRRGALLLAAGLTPDRTEPYVLGEDNPVSSDAFNRAAIRLRTDADGFRRFTEGGELTGELELPLLTVHSTGDGQVPIAQAQVLARRVAAARRQDLLVQRVIPDVSHCGFTTSEWEASLDALVGWVERGERPDGTDLAVDDLRRLDRTFEVLPRPGTPEGDDVDGAGDRVVLRGRARVDGAPLEARWLGAVVRRDGLVTTCGLELVSVAAGRYETTVVADDEAEGCGARGAEVVLWTIVDDEKVFSTRSLPWPDGPTAEFDVEFSTDDAAGAAPVTTDFSGEVYRGDGRRLPPGTRVEAFVGDTRCGVAAVKRTGNFSGFVLNMVGPDSVAGCRTGGRLMFRLDGRPAIETAVNSPGRSEPLDLTVR